MTIPQTFQIAVQHHQAGRLADAEALYRQILAAQPGHADALHFLGALPYEERSAMKMRMDAFGQPTADAFDLRQLVHPGTAHLGQATERLK